jgi:hypothetical protein
MRAELSEADFQVIGPPLIDATEARLDPIASKGVLVLLEARRTIRFGRPPQAAAVGERPRRRSGRTSGARSIPARSARDASGVRRARLGLPRRALGHARHHLARRRGGAYVDPQKKRP